MNIYLKGKSNVYQQIVDQYKRYISLNVIKYMEKLPSCRALASQLGINPNTVERAYSILENEKYIITIPKKGAYACYQKESENENKFVIQQIKELKQSGIKKEELLEMIEKVYKED